jgi:hypothetical protein
MNNIPFLIECPHLNLIHLNPPPPFPIYYLNFWFGSEECVGVYSKENVLKSKNGFLI